MTDLERENTKTLTTNRTFCVLPWVSLATETDGRARICCAARGHVTDENGERVRLPNVSFAEIWNSQYMAEIRKNMVAGESTETCRQCYTEESMGGRSLRICQNEEWFASNEEDLLDRIQHSVKNDGRVQENPLYLDLRFSNQCNLKCRSCAPEYSSPLAEEYYEIGKSSSWFRDNLKLHELETNRLPDWSGNNSIKDSLAEMIPSLQRVYFAGGEPTLIKSVYDFLEKCLELGCQKKVCLELNLNLTNFSHRFIQLIQQFETVSINVSIDGFEAEQEYLRYPSKWANITRNLDRLFEAASHGIEIYFTPVVQISNVLSLPRLLDFFLTYCQKLPHQAKIQLLLLHEYEFMRASLLPGEWKKLAVDRLRPYLERGDSAGVLRSTLELTIAALEQEDQCNAEEMRKKFLEHTKLLDQWRGQGFANIFPETAHALGLGTIPEISRIETKLVEIP